jgi:hypothetical protein
MTLWMEWEMECENLFFFALSFADTFTRPADRIRTLSLLFFLFHNHPPVVPVIRILPENYFNHLDAMSSSLMRIGAPPPSQQVSSNSTGEALSHRNHPGDSFFHPGCTLSHIPHVPLPDFFLNTTFSTSRTSRRRPSRNSNTSNSNSNSLRNPSFRKRSSSSSRTSARRRNS